MIDPKTINFSYSLLKQIRKCPLRALLLKEEPKPSTPEQLLNLAIECAIQEPDRFDKEYYVYVPEDGKSDRRGTNDWKEKEKKAGVGKLLKQKDYDVIRRIRDNFYKDEILSYIYSRGKAQQVLEWDRDGINCKGVPDFMSDVVPVIIDIKVVNEASDETVTPMIFRPENLWHVQAAMYQAGAAANGMPQYKSSGILFVESQYPYLINAIELTDRQIELGRIEFEKYFDIWWGALKINNFGGYGDGFHQVETPYYYERKFYAVEY